MRYRAAQVKQKKKKEEESTDLLQPSPEPQAIKKNRKSSRHLGPAHPPDAGTQRCHPALPSRLDLERLSELCVCVVGTRLRTSVLLLHFLLFLVRKPSRELPSFCPAAEDGESGGEKEKVRALLLSTRQFVCGYSPSLAGVLVFSFVCV